MRKHGRVYDKKYLVLRLDVYCYRVKSKDEDKLRKLRWDYGGEYVEFTIDLINKFCSRNFEDLSLEFFNPKNKYKKSHIFGPYDVGMDMLEEELGLRREHNWNYIYFKIPRENEELIKFFESQKFSFEVKTVQTI